MMNQIAQLLPEANIALNLEATSKKRLFEQIGHKIFKVLNLIETAITGRQNISSKED